jgi:hypothetical protein
MTPLWHHRCEFLVVPCLRCLPGPCSSYSRSRRQVLSLTLLQPCDILARNAHERPVWIVA